MLIDGGPDYFFFYVFCSCFFAGCCFRRVRVDLSIRPCYPCYFCPRDFLLLCLALLCSALLGFPFRFVALAWLRASPPLSPPVSSLFPSNSLSVRLPLYFCPFVVVFLSLGVSRRGWRGRGGGGGAFGSLLLRCVCWWRWRRRRAEQDHVSFASTDFRRGVYEELLTRIRLVIITRMAKPEEVLIVEDENGERGEEGGRGGRWGVEGSH